MCCGVRLLSTLVSGFSHSHLSTHLHSYPHFQLCTVTRGSYMCSCILLCVLSSVVLELVSCWNVGACGTFSVQAFLCAVMV